MASPIHSYLFSPPSSPPVLPADHVLRSPALSSIRSLIPSNTLPRSSIDGAVKARSPLTQQSRFTLDSTYPAFPSRLRERKDVFTLTVEDTSLSASSSRPNSPRITEKILLGSPGHYLNVPTVAQPVPRGMPGLPKPVIRLLWLASLLITSMMLLVYVPGSRLPSLHTASVSRRLAMASDGRAYVDVLDPIKGWQDAKDRDYVPPQIFAGRLDRRVEAARVAPVVRVPTRESFPLALSLFHRLISAHPKANRPSPRPLPRSHEILALQSYLLQSSYNVLPADLDTDAPLDANLVLGYAADEIALHELEAERAQDIVVRCRRVFFTPTRPPRSLGRSARERPSPDTHPSIHSTRFRQAPADPPAPRLPNAAWRSRHDGQQALCGGSHRNERYEGEWKAGELARFDRMGREEGGSEESLEAEPGQGEEEGDDRG